MSYEIRALFSVLWIALPQDALEPCCWSNLDLGLKPVGSTETQRALQELAGG